MLLCHIVGFNNKLKNDFVSTLINLSDNILVLDIDDISKKIMFDKDFSKFYNQFIDPNNKNKIVLLQQLSFIWKNKITTEINNILNINESKFIILIGLITFFLDYRIKINLNEEINNKFFVNTNTQDHIKQLIEYNLHTYKNDIINGSFPLKYLDHTYLKTQRNELRDQYFMRDYKLKNYDTIINWIEQNTKSFYNKENSKPVYIASFNRYEDSIPMHSDSIIGYNDKWLALASLYPKNKFKKGVSFVGGIKRPYIKELGLQYFKELNKCCYLYELFPSKHIDNFRSLIDNNTFIKREYISNIKKELELNDTFFDNYKLI